MSGILQLLVLDSWRDCAHTDRDKSLSMMQSWWLVLHITEEEHLSCFALGFITPVSEIGKACNR